MSRGEREFWRRILHRIAHSGWPPVERQIAPRGTKSCGVTRACAPAGAAARQVSVGHGAPAGLLDRFPLVLGGERICKVLLAISAVFDRATIYNDSRTRHTRPHLRRINTTRTRALGVTSYSRPPKKHVFASPAVACQVPIIRQFWCRFFAAVRNPKKLAAFRQDSARQIRFTQRVAGSALRVVAPQNTRASTHT